MEFSFLFSQKSQFGHLTPGYGPQFNGNSEGGDGADSGSTNKMNPIPERKEILHTNQKFFAFSFDTSHVMRRNMTMKQPSTFKNENTKPKKETLLFSPA